MKKLIFTLVLLSAFSGHAQAEQVLKWKKIQAGASGGAFEVKEIVLGDFKSVGHNYWGNLGTTTNIATNNANPNPITIPDFTGAKQCATNKLMGAFVHGYTNYGGHTVCVMYDGTVKGVGLNYHGQLGVNTNVGTYNPIQTPVVIKGFEGAKECYAGIDHTTCIMSNGKVKATGNNNYGQLGDGSNTQKSSPVEIVGFNGAKNCSLNPNANNPKTICVMNDGTVRVTGYQNNGQFGNGTKTAQTYYAPNIVNWGGNIKQCSTGSHTICVREDGQVLGSGLNNFGQLGIAGAATRYSPESIPLLNGAKSCSVNGVYTICVMNNGEVKATGSGATGSTTPTSISDLEGAIDCDTGVNFAVCLMNNGDVKSLGVNTYGQLGDGSTTQRTTPVIISSFQGANKCYAGAQHTVCISSSLSCNPLTDKFGSAPNGGLFFCKEGEWKEFFFKWKTKLVQQSNTN